MEEESFEINESCIANIQAKCVPTGFCNVL
jgi:hypothetical protein